MYMWKLFAYKKIFAHGKIKRKEVHGKKEKKNMSREERKSTILSRNEKNSFVKATGTGRAPCWCPDWFWTKKLLLNWNLPHIMLKMRFPFLYASTSLKTKTSTRIIILKAVNCLAPQHIFQFFHRCHGLFFCLWHFCLLLCHPPQCSTEWSRLKTCVCNRLLFPGNLNTLSMMPGGPVFSLVCSFRRWDNLLA